MDSYAIDTNILVRLFVKDDLEQTLKAEKIINKIEQKKISVSISILVVNELLWVMKNYYNVRKKEVIYFLIKLLSLENIGVLEINKKHLIEVLNYFSNKNIDFTDAYLLKNFDKKMIFSFDKDLQ